MFNRSKSAKFFRLALTATLLAFGAALFSAYSRLSEYGVGCPDWPGCYGKLFAPQTASDIELAKQLEGIKTAPENRAWKEMAQRYLAAALGLVLIRLAMLGWQLKKRKRTQQWIIPGLAMLLVFSLGFVGLLTFTHQLKPLIMMMQLLGGVLALGLLWWIVMREQRFWRSISASPLTRALRPRTLVALAVVAMQIVLGGWSMVNYAGLACPDFPTCQGSWWPPMDFTEAFTRWNDVGINYEGRLLNLPSATAIHMAHRLGALITLMYVGWLSLHVLRVGDQQNLCRYGLLVLIMLLSAIALGVAEVVTRLPVAMAVAHNGVALLLLMSLITLHHVVRPPRAS